ncbi:Lipopolysaccharide-modifying protein [Metarhizium album ARSEF 1941]|uniref:Lipopolysaccharide-modifying protein n=1 Tax=Metarhizium album (strain ARSEF 1941) TaxID=1081103 RepID=A0A0B2X0T6_METAS|nr:Lipopolysaccharide-modifying protein [Metarhizium album ARSEF 1941]KHN99479.1 Lipopolysaccharide-modifying protein [Metarhizium album ARSEF 1941]
MTAAFVLLTIFIYTAVRILHLETKLAFNQASTPTSKESPSQSSAHAGQKLDSSSTLASEPTTVNDVHATSRPSEELQDDWGGAAAIQGGHRAKDVPSSERHPIQHLMVDARRELDEVTKRQSKDLESAVKEYRRRYGMPPPPHFDKWFEFARSNKVQLVDEFDTIYHLITPFWGLKPKTIRERAREALGHENALIGVAIRNHQVSHMEGGMEWQRDATHGMLRGFLQHLPDMDLAFNVHDEPRVIVPHDDLARLVRKAKTENMPALNANRSPTNDYSKTSPELSDKMLFEQVKHSRFNSFSHQATWTHSRMSCPPDSPARILDDDERWDDLGQYGVSELGFVYNSTAMADICLSPSLSSTYGFFDRPNTYKVVHDLFPIFSQSKISSYNDIIYPSPWYWYDKVKYEQEKDIAWDEKHSKLYWRGSTTGGFSRDGGWRRQHRQHFVKKINAAGQAKIVNNEGSESQPRWAVADVSRAEYSALTDVAFSHVGQCDEGDCKAQQAFFNISSRANQSDAWGYKYLLDIDGNAFSGRFLAFLHSTSLTFKLALFREWHNEWLKPWVHYVPLSLQGEDWLETVRFVDGSSLGAEDGKHMAAESREWAAKTMRKEDMEVWFFRLLLE